MGQVFRARDTRLKRDVALKVLVESIGRDPDRRSRFQREAQVLGSLNHTNIAQIFGIEDAGGEPVIAMELVPGPTLSEHQHGRALPVAEALTIARQLCEGLEAAHERGIVHRDLKPGNIKLRDDGAVKILDFGLAKALSDSEAREDATSDSPTVLSPATEAGLILGTAAYMSPEQARGRVVDKRTDVWAFGCVLYEMLTGRPVFAGETTTDILAAVIRSEPDWSKLPVGVPSRMVELLRRCLQANPKDRLRDIGDARYEIERALHGGTTESQSERGSSTLVPARAAGSSSPSRVLWALMGAAVAAGILILLPRTSETGSSTVASSIRSIVTFPAETTLAPSRGSAVALSPDGRMIAFVGRSKGRTLLYVRPLDRYEFQQLAGTDGAANPFFSPDGKWLGFFADGMLKKVAIEGGTPVAVAEARNARGEAWGDDNTILMTPLNNVGLSRVSALGGDKPVALTTLKEGELSHRWPRILPGGSAVLYSIWNDTGWEPARVAVRPMPTGEPKIIVPAGGGYPRYVRDTGRRGYLVYARADGVLAAPFDEDRLDLTGPAVPVVDGVLTNLSGGAHFDISSNGTLAYVPGIQTEGQRDLVWVTRDGMVTPVLKIHNMSRFWSLSSDGTRVARNNTAGPNRDVWIEHLTNGTSLRLTQSNDTYDPIWSPDGTWLVFSRGIPYSNIYRRPADASDVEERLTNTDKNQQPNQISADGRSLLYNEIDPASGSDIWVLTIPDPVTPIKKGEITAPARPFIKTNHSEGNATFSPDGRFVLYQSNETGRFEIYVRPYPEGVRKFPVSSSGGIWPRWSSTGREIFYRSTGNVMMSATVDTSGEFQSGKPQALFDAAGYEIIYSPSPDGRRFLMMPGVAAEASATQLNLVTGFLSELRNRVK